MLLPAVLLWGGVGPTLAEEADDLFNRYEVATGIWRHQTVVPGFFFGNAVADLAVVIVGPDGSRYVRMYELEGGAWVVAGEAELRPGVLFVDVANIDGRDRLITGESRRLNWFDPGSSTERALVSVDASYGSFGEGALPRVDITRDLNDDGRDDLVVPDVDGFWISIQLSDGGFSDAVKLGPAEPFADEPTGNLDLDQVTQKGSRSYGDAGITPLTISWYLSRLHEMDYDRDGRTDLVFWNEDHFDVHIQDETGQFDPVDRTFTTNVPFDSDGVYSRMFDSRDEGVFSLVFGAGKITQRTVLHSLDDLNGDQITDLVTLTLSGRSLTRQRSVYEVHLGAPAPGGTVFARDASATIHPGGRAGGMEPWGYASQQFEDFDSDGRVDVMFRRVKVGIGGMLRALVGNSVSIDLEYYRVEDDVYPDTPSTMRKIRRFAPLAGLGNVFLPAVLMGDVNGDGRSDLLVGHSPEQLHVYLGVAGPDLLARQPIRVAAKLPADERRTWLMDLNNDGKQDVIAHRSSKKEPHLVTMLVAR